MVKGLSILVIFWTILYKTTESGLTKRSSRMIREVYPEIQPDNEGNQAQVCIVGDVVYGVDETVPADQPCLKCKCQPPGVQCETIQCVKRQGCKAIHKPNQCCPEYQCECEHNNKFYANGEKLETPPGGECKVCYCRGGEVQCAEVSCYIRKDCQGKRVLGTCCPKYDHCPPIDPSFTRNGYTTDILSDSKSQFDLLSMTTIPSNSTENINPTSNDLQNENKIPDTNYYEPTEPTENYKTEDDHLQRNGLISKITIQEIIPERKEIPVTASPKVSVEPHGTLVIEEADEFLNNSNDLVVTDSDPDSSEILETFHQSPPVLRIGDKLLFLKKGEFIHEKDTSTPSSVITIIGAEGLQRGYEDSVEIHESKVENSEWNHTYPIENSTISVDSSEITDLNQLVLNTAASTHILSLVKRKHKPSSTDTPDTTLLPSVIEDSSSVTTENVVGDNSTLEENVNFTEPTKSSTPGDTKAYEIITDQNPAYPPVPEIMSPNNDDTSQRFEIDNINKSTTSENVTNVEWLESNPGNLINFKASLPEELLNQAASSDLEDSTDVVINTSELPLEETSVEQGAQKSFSKSVESLEEIIIESGERVTSANSHSALLSTENASIEHKGDSSEANDMVAEKESSENNSIEKTTPSGITRIDRVDEKTKNEPSNKSIDVEIIDIKPLQKHKPSLEKEVVEAEKFSNTPLRIIKRESPPDNEVFKELDKELNDEQTERNLSKDEEQKEADAIFRELLEESSTPKIEKANSETEILSRVTNALAQFSLRGKDPDVNILSMLSNFFNNQYKE